MKSLPFFFAVLTLSTGGKTAAGTDNAYRVSLSGK